MTASLRVGALVLALCSPILSAAPVSAATAPAQIAYVRDADADGSGAIVLRDLRSRTSRTLVPEGAYVESPEISPDGTTVAFATDIGSTTGDVGIAVISTTGGGFRRLTDPPGETLHTITSDTDPSWAADGSLVFARVTDDDRGESVRGTLHRVASTGGPVTGIAGTGNAMSPDVDATGTQVTFISLSATNVGAGTVARQSLVAPTAERTSLGGFGYDPTWSPDGTRVAWATVGDGVPDGLAYVRVAEPTPPAVRLLPYTRTVLTFAPFWLADGRSIVYSRFDTTRPDATADLWAVDADAQRNGPFLASAADELYGSALDRASVPISGGMPSTYVAADPLRLLDTRPETTVGTSTPGRVGTGGTVRVQVAGRETASGTVPADVTAVVLNVTATAATASTDVRAYPSGGAVPEASNLNVTAGRTVPNLVTVAVGNDGAVVLRNGAGEVHLLADLAGWYVPGNAAGRFTALEPRRILDTRPGSGAVGVTTPGRIGPGGVLGLKVTGELPVSGGGQPVSVPTSATAVVLNVTGTAPTRGTDVRAYPRGPAAAPEVSNLNLAIGATAPNLVVVRVGEGGIVDLRNASGEVHLIADLAGWYGPDGVAAFVPAAPARLLDTRDGTGAAPVSTGAGRAVDAAVSGWRGVPTDAVATALNLTATGASASTDVRAYPATATQTPVVSNLNVTAGATRANAVVVKTGTDGEVRFRNNAGSVHLIADLAGWFVPTA